MINGIQNFNNAIEAKKFKSKNCNLFCNESALINEQASHETIFLSAP